MHFFQLFFVTALLLLNLRAHWRPHPLTPIDSFTSLHCLPGRSKLFIWVQPIFSFFFYNKREKREERKRVKHKKWKSIIRERKSILLNTRVTSTKKKNYSNKKVSSNRHKVNINLSDLSDCKVQKENLKIISSANISEVNRVKLSNQMCVN